MAFKENIKTHTYDTGCFQKVTWQSSIGQRRHYQPFFEELYLELVNGSLRQRKTCCILDLADFELLIDSQVACIAANSFVILLTTLKANLQTGL